MNDENKRAGSGQSMAVKVTQEHRVTGCSSIPAGTQLSRRSDRHELCVVAGGVVATLLNSIELRHRMETILMRQAGGIIT